MVLPVMPTRFLPPSEADAIALLHRAIDLVGHFDTAALYGFGKVRNCWGAPER